MLQLINFAPEKWSPVILLVDANIVCRTVQSLDNGHMAIVYEGVDLHEAGKSRLYILLSDKQF